MGAAAAVNFVGQRVAGSKNPFQKTFNKLTGVWDDISGQSAADAAGAAAMAQSEEAKRTREAIMGESRRLESDAMNLARMSPEEMRAYGISLQAGERQLASEQRLLEAVDPALMQASENVLKLLRGDSPKPRSLDALQAQRGQQRQALVDRLIQQLGPGAETSSVGLKALRDFDIASSADLARTGQSFDMNDQQMRLNELQGLGQIMGVSGSLRPDMLGTGINLTNLASVFRNRELNTRMGVGANTLGALSGSSQAVIQSAGAPYMRDFYAAQGRQSLYNKGLSGVMSYFGGGGGMGA